MIYTNSKERFLNYNSPLIDYIRKNNQYNNEKLLYTSKYTEGTFSITNPTLNYTNCKLINGYPHFSVPLEICLDEIEFFITGQSMYSNNFYIRYGDTHPDKCIPKLAQIRNLLIENAISGMIGPNCKSYYGYGDISIKSLKDFICKYNINIDSESLFKKVVNNQLNIDLQNKLNDYNYKTLKELSDFLHNLNFNVNEFLIESNLYKNNDLYNEIKNNPTFKSELKKNGELKYSLQELVFIRSILKNKNDILINIIGSNQSEHIIKVNHLLEQYYNLDNRFLSYGICLNGQERNYLAWSTKLNSFIEQNNLKTNDELITYKELLNILTIINSNDIIIDYENLHKYKDNIQKFNNIIGGIENINGDKNIECGNDLIYKMALVSYNLNRAVEFGNQNTFYRYIITVVNDYETNKDKYKNIQGLYKEFLIQCFNRLGYTRNEKTKELVK